jgi:hypothetical protein
MLAGIAMRQLHEHSIDEEVSHRRPIFAHANSRRETRPRLLLRRAHPRSGCARDERPARRPSSAQRRRARGSSPPDRRRGFGRLGSAHLGQTSSVEATEIDRSVLVRHRGHPAGRFRVCARYDAQEEAGEARRAWSAAHNRSIAGRSSRSRPGSGMGNHRAPKNRTGAGASYPGQSGFARPVWLARRVTSSERGWRGTGRRDRTLRDVLPPTASIP